eukprot:m.27821 g.27821  ORF g.27821 m.27821 type:complete len:57 (+) comp15816_c0_seq1:325-495(+)
MSTNETIDEDDNDNAWERWFSNDAYVTIVNVFLAYFVRKSILNSRVNAAGILEVFS